MTQLVLKDHSGEIICLYVLPCHTHLCKMLLIFGINYILVKDKK